MFHCLPTLTGIWQKRLGSWTSWSNTEIEVDPTRVCEDMGRPVECASRKERNSLFSGFLANQLCCEVSNLNTTCTGCLIGSDNTRAPSSRFPVKFRWATLYDEAARILTKSEDQTGLPQLGMSVTEINQLPCQNWLSSWN